MNQHTHQAGTVNGLQIYLHKLLNDLLYTGPTEETPMSPQDAHLRRWIRIASVRILNVMLIIMLAFSTILVISQL